MIIVEEQFLAGIYTPEFLKSTEESDEDGNTTVVPVVDSATSSGGRRLLPTKVLCLKCTCISLAYGIKVHNFTYTCHRSQHPGREDQIRTKRISQKRSKPFQVN